MIKQRRNRSKHKIQLNNQKGQFFGGQLSTTHFAEIVSQMAKLFKTLFPSASIINCQYVRRRVKQNKYSLALKVIQSPQRHGRAKYSDLYLRADGFT